MLSRARFRPYLSLAAMLAVPAKSALATSPVELAHAQEQAVGSWSWSAEAQAPASPLAIASTLGVMVAPLAAREPVQIQLRTPEPAQRHKLAFDRQYQVDPQEDDR